MKEQIARLLLEKSAFKISIDPPFTLTSGLKSPIYCDNRILNSYVDAREQIIEGYLQIIKKNNLEFDSISGVATGAISFGALVADRLKKPYSYVRPEPKKHGAQKQVEGVVQKDEKVLIIEDLFSTAKSATRAIEGIRRETGAEIIGIISISTHGFPEAEKKLKEINVKWWTLTNLKTIVQETDLSQKDKEMILTFAKDPQNWWKNFQK